MAGDAMIEAGDFLLRAAQLQASLQVLNSAPHAAPFWARLERGLPITLGVVGASVGMSGGCQRELQPHVRCAGYDGSGGLKEGAYACKLWVHPGQRGFALRALDWINSTFPHAGHRLQRRAALPDSARVAGAGARSRSS